MNKLYEQLPIDIIHYNSIIVSYEGKHYVVTEVRRIKIEEVTFKTYVKLSTGDYVELEKCEILKDRFCELRKK